jgi:hypothetical protein
MGDPMATMEERLEALEQDFRFFKLENAALRNLNELQTNTIRAMATKSELARVRDVGNTIFDALISQNQFTNERLGDIQTQVIELDGKITGLQVETRQGFQTTQTQVTELDGKVVGLQTEMRQRFEQQDARFEMQGKQLETQGKQLEQILLLLTNKPK